MNKAILIGRVGKDAELVSHEDSKKSIRFSLATSEYNASSKKEFTTWHNVVVWGNYAESLANIIKKGSLVSVIGSINNSAYEKEGVKCVYSSVNADKVEVLNKISGSEPDSDHTETHRGYEQPARQSNDTSFPPVDTEDDLPF